MLKHVMEKGAGGNSARRRPGGGGLTPQYRGEPRGNPPRTVWSAEREEHEQVISTIPKIRQTTGDTRGRKNVDVHVQICSEAVEHNMKNTFKMTSGKGVGKYCEKRCPGQAQHMFGPYGAKMDSRGHLLPRNNLQNRKKTL